MTAEQAANVHRSYAWVHGPNDALVRSSAEQWLALAPQNEDAALAVAKAAVAQRDVDAALAILDPKISAGLRRPDLVAVWLEARARSTRRASAPYHPIDLGPAITLAREVLAAHPRDEALQRSVREAAP